MGVGVGVALGEVLLDSITVYSGTTTPNMVTGAVVLISSTASPSVAMIGELVHWVYTLMTLVLLHDTYHVQLCYI